MATDHNQENLTKFGCVPDMEVKHFKHHFIYLEYNYGDFFSRHLANYDLAHKYPLHVLKPYFSGPKFIPKKTFNWPAVFVFFPILFCRGALGPFFSQNFFECVELIFLRSPKKKKLQNPKNILIRASGFSFLGKVYCIQIDDHS